MITIIADEGKNQIGLELYEGFLSQGAEAEYISLEDVQVKHCLNCGSCANITFGRCIVRDDGDWIYPRIIQSEVLIFVSPITFGSYSFKVKRVFDKFGTFMDGHYFVVNGELVKGGMIGRQFKFFAVGFAEDCSDQETEAFRKLVRENLIITRGAGNAFVIKGPLAPEYKDEIIKEVVKL